MLFLVHTMMIVSDFIRKGGNCHEEDDRTSRRRLFRLFNRRCSVRTGRGSPGARSAFRGAVPGAASGNDTLAASYNHDAAPGYRDPSAHYDDTSSHDNRPFPDDTASTDDNAAATCRVRDPADDNAAASGHDRAPSTDHASSACHYRATPGHDAPSASGCRRDISV